MVETSFPELETTPAERRARASGPQAKPGRFSGKSAYSMAIYVILIVAVFVSLLPFGYVVSTSFKSTMSLFSYPPNWLPKNPTLDNYRHLLSRYPFWRWLFNSFVVAGSVTAIKLIVDSMAGYAFAKMRFPGRNALFLVVLMSLMVPFASLLIPTFIIIRELGMLNTYWGLILPGLANAQAVFLLRDGLAHGGLHLGDGSDGRTLERDVVAHGRAGEVHREPEVLGQLVGVAREDHPLAHRTSSATPRVSPPC